MRGRPARMQAVIRRSVFFIPVKIRKKADIAAGLIE
jgi:hypothetical protein